MKPKEKNVFLVASPSSQNIMRAPCQIHRFRKTGGTEFAYFADDTVWGKKVRHTLQLVSFLFRGRTWVSHLRDATSLRTARRERGVNISRRQRRRSLPQEATSSGCNVKLKRLACVACDRRTPKNASAQFAKKSFEGVTQAQQ